MHIYICVYIHVYICIRVYAMARLCACVCECICNSLACLDFIRLTHILTYTQHTHTHVHTPNQSTRDYIEKQAEKQRCEEVPLSSCTSFPPSFSSRLVKYSVLYCACIHSCPIPAGCFLIHTLTALAIPHTHTHKHIQTNICSYLAVDTTRR